MDDIQELYHIFPSLKGKITIVKKVGQGTFSYVYLAHLASNEEEKFALKYIIPTSSPSRTKQEIECLLKIGGQDNVVGVHAVLRQKSHVLILMPYVEHVAFHETYLEWSLNEIKNYIKNLLISLDRVHKFNIIHRDVKPSNFLYDRNKKQYALVDFGLAQVYDKSSISHHLLLNDENKLINRRPSSIFLTSTPSTNSNNNTKLINKNAKSSSPIIISTNSKSPTILTTNSTTTNSIQKHYSFHKSSYNLQLDGGNGRNSCSCFNMPFVCDICTLKSAKWAPRAGTAGFRAPEVLFRYTNQTTAVDVWSAGIILLCLLSGRYPFFKATDDNMAIMQLISLFGSEAVRKIALKYGEALVCSVEKETIDLKYACDKLRSTTSSVSSSQIYPDSVYDLLKHLLELDFEKRYTAEQALNHDFFKES